ncbi:dehydrogenase/reductase SDR family member 12 isoform X3 [Callithrix jacchus]
MIDKRELTEDGLEKNFATSTLGVYIFTTSLIPVLQKEQDPQVITVSSGGMLVQKLNTNDLRSERTPFDGTVVYAQNKVRDMGFPRLHCTHGLCRPSSKESLLWDAQ